LQCLRCLGRDMQQQEDEDEDEDDKEETQET